MMSRQKDDAITERLAQERRERLEASPTDSSEMLAQHYTDYKDGSLVDVISRAQSVIEEADGADEHAALIAELPVAVGEANRLVAFVEDIAHGSFTSLDDVRRNAAAILAKMVGR